MNGISYSPSSGSPVPLPLDVVRDRGEDTRDLATENAQNDHGSNGDQRQDQRVLDERLTLLPPQASLDVGARPNVCHQHVFLLPLFVRRLCQPDAVEPTLVMYRLVPPSSTH